MHNSKMILNRRGAETQRENLIETLRLGVSGVN